MVAVIVIVSSRFAALTMRCDESSEGPTRGLLHSSIGSQVAVTNWVLEKLQGLVAELEEMAEFGNRAGYGNPGEQVVKNDFLSFLGGVEWTQIQRGGVLNPRDR